MSHRDNVVLFTNGVLDRLRDFSGASDFEHEPGDSDWTFQHGAFWRTIVRPGAVVYRFCLFKTPKGWRLETELSRGRWVLIELLTTGESAEATIREYMRGLKSP